MSTPSKFQKKTRKAASLQPLRIPTGWSVRWNNFYDVQPAFHSHDSASFYFDEDMLLLVNEHQQIAVDLGWYPAFQSTGGFVLLAVRHIGEGSSEDWGHPLRKLRTRSKQKVVREIERWLEFFSTSAPK